MSEAVSPALILDRVGKTFHQAEVPSLYPTSLEIQGGELITLLGSSGCGKTTLLRLINRLIEPSCGKILINGQDTSLMPPPLLRRQIGYAIQQVGLFPHASVAENIATVPRLLKWESTRIYERVETLLSLVHLPAADFAHRYPRELSGGQQQRVGLARALAAEPQLLLMDEPFGAIDAINRTHLQDEFLSIQRQLNTTVLFVTHDVGEALKLGHRVIVMHQGQVQQMDTPQNILAHPANDFVASLLDTGDFYRQLEFLRAIDLMRPLVSGDSPTSEVIDETQTLRSVLFHLLLSGANQIVVQRDQEPVGMITLEMFRQMSRRYQIPERLG